MVTTTAPRGGDWGGLAPSRLGAALRERLTSVAEAALTPIEPAEVLDLVHPLRSGTDLRARIVSIHAETRDAATIVLKPGRDWAGHTPGQYIRIGIDVDGVRHWRAYSLTHGPRKDGHISITVKAVPGGIVSNHLVHRARRGTLVHLEQAAGEFILPTDLRGAKLLFVTAGSGITPVIGMLRNLFPVTDDGVLFSRWDRNRGRGASGAGASRPDITVVHVAPSEPDSIFLDHLQTLHAAGAINLVARYDDEHGVLDVERLEELVPDLAERSTYACGPGGLLDALSAHHEARGLPLFTEQFRVSTVAAGEGGTVAFSSGSTVEVDGDQTILDAAEDAGVLMPSGCRMGICMGCVLPMTEGAVRDLRNGELTVAKAGETPSGGVKVQTCISSAAGPCSFDH